MPGAGVNCSRPPHNHTYILCNTNQQQRRILHDIFSVSCVRICRCHQPTYRLAWIGDRVATTSKILMAMVNWSLSFSMRKLHWHWVNHCKRKSEEKKSEIFQPSQKNSRERVWQCKICNSILPPPRGGGLSQRLKKGQIWPKINSENIPEFENVKSGDGILPPSPGGNLSQGSNSRGQ